MQGPVSLEYGSGEYQPIIRQELKGTTTGNRSGSYSNP